MTARIAILVEGATEQAFKKPLIEFLGARLAGQMPKLVFVIYDGRIPKGNMLQRDVLRLLKNNDAVVALTDVYTGKHPPDFENAPDARAKMRAWVGFEEARFFPHAAQFDFEAWLLPYWSRIQTLAGSSRRSPSQSPENVNHDKPPARHLAEVFRTGSRPRRYSKPREAIAILSGQDLSVSAGQCPQLKAFLNSILDISGAEPLK